MIYTIEANGRTVATTNNKNNLERARTIYPDASIRWATPTEAKRFRDMQEAEQRKWWPVLIRRIEAALWWLFDTSFPTIHKQP
jgi:hypothetical protein